MSKISKVQQQIKIQGASFQGPLPHPNDFAQYDTVLPGAAERILAMTEKQASHRQNIEYMVLRSDGRRAWVGTVFAFLLGLVGLTVSGYVIVQGHDWAGAGMGGATLTSMVTSFIYGSSKRLRERKEETLPARK